MEIGCYQAGKDVGQGVQWSEDRAQAWEVQDGEKGRSISLEGAAQIAAQIGLPVPRQIPRALRRRLCPQFTLFMQ